jgi:hypothetical protein
VPGVVEVPMKAGTCMAYIDRGTNTVYYASLLAAKNQFKKDAK